MKKLRIAVLMHEDLVPPDKVAKADLKGAEWRTEHEVVKTLRDMGHEVEIISTYNCTNKIRSVVHEFKPHVVFNLLVEFNGVATFDHNVVSFLELLGVPYTGCNPKGLVLARDKSISKKILSYHDIRTAEFNVIRKGAKATLSKGLEYPVIVKSLTEEASQGISQASVVNSDEELADRVQLIHEKVGSDVILENYIDGKELYVGIIGNKRLETLPVWELHFKNVPDNFIPIATSRVKWNDDYREKHGIASGPAEGIAADELERIQEVCKEAYRRLRLSGYARMDLRYTEDGKIFILEANPNPGIATDEEFPKAAKAAGMEYADLLGRIVSLGMGFAEN